MTKTTPNSWFVITGAPSSGKTTLLAELDKLGYKTIPEAARQLIDEALERGMSVEKLRADERQFQIDIAKLKQKIEDSLDKNTVVVFDRGMHDTLAYMRNYDFAMEPWMIQLMEQANYQKVFLLEPLPNFERDYARTEDADFVHSIDRLLQMAYAEYGMQPIVVPAVNVADRVKLIVDEISANGNPKE